MTTSTLSTFFAVLSLIALGGAVITFLLLYVLRGDRWRPWLHEIGRLGLPLAWLVAAVATGGSLYYSEVAHFTPCVLCWYQRIVIYPLAVMLGIATFRRDTSIRVYVVVQCAIGVVISSYHAWIQAYPPESGTSFCTLEAPCTARHVWEFGFVSLPFMALTAELAIIALVVAAGRAARADRFADDAPEAAEEAPPTPVGAAR